MARARILLIIGGGIAAYKSLDLIRRLRERDIEVRTVMTASAREFITPLSVAALSNAPVFEDLFDVDDEREIGHIRLSRQCDLIVVAPATANLMAKLANGLADDLASATLLASAAPIVIAPAMNPKMWSHPATQRNLMSLKADGHEFVGPGVGEMAERGEAGVGRLAEPLEIVSAIEARLGLSGPDGANPSERADLTGAGRASSALRGRHVIITSGPTHEPIDPVRYIANRSSGRQGLALARAARAAGADVTLISGPTGLPAPDGVRTVDVTTAEQMLKATLQALPADAAIFAAAVADWRVSDVQTQKMKKKKGVEAMQLDLVRNPDILKTVAGASEGRPGLVIGFAAETENLIAHAEAKLNSKGADLIVANDVSEEGGVMGSDDTTVHLVTTSGHESWPLLTKDEVARRLMDWIGARLTGTPS